RKPWYDLYEAIATSREAFQAMDKKGLKVGLVNATTPDGADTPRARVFTKFIIGVSNIYLGMLYDQAYVNDANTDVSSFEYVLKPHPEVTAAGIRVLQEAITEAQAAPAFTIPSIFINNATGISKDDFIRIMRSYIIRAQVYSARTPQERAAVNWASILTQLDAGINKNFSQQADLTITQTASAYYQYAYLQTNGRTNNRLIGPADTSGEYQRWLARPLNQKTAITIVTPDRRIHGAAGPTTAGTAFAFLPTQTMTNARGTYPWSSYRSVKYLNPPANNYHQTGVITTMSVAEMNFIRAEALFRLNRGAEAAAIINVTRQAAGLRPVTAAGPPAGADCVPRKDDGTCGDLFDAIQYEKRIDLFPTEAIIAYVDARGWGKLLPGTPIHLPVHGRELETLGFPYYTFGGGGVGSAP
ncbi:MAG TPA: RagB/SusD family nutrient uptake outer membrane protein, partial [Gemmatimonas sp.]|nr:RagB/SusD family nutrient uptake outer membrane protein [Gemmatimonas sp.]